MAGCSVSAADRDREKVAAQPCQVLAAHTSRRMASARAAVPSTERFAYPVLDDTWSTTTGPASQRDLEERRRRCGHCSGALQSGASDAGGSASGKRPGATRSVRPADVPKPAASQLV